MSKPYLETWLRRTRKQLAASGRLSELAMVLATEDPSTRDEWRLRLQRMVDGDVEPDLELLTKIDSLLAKPAADRRSGDFQADLFS